MSVRNWGWDLNKWFVGRAPDLRGWWLSSPRRLYEVGGPLAVTVDTFEEAMALVKYELDFGPEMLGFALIGLRERGLVR